ncbi:Na+/H+ antiporter NhaA [Haloactinomyces albus]|uniref:Na(+)/H(+) antiporter NhaA n=1 Tax=Haloactinomyces albus TaxID=1352928 RepID=A0AAE4CLL6_9ACTN|nr:Na+/H+ antiporter NhaA [Haloactinomyces albus]MDR7300057.1 NhaA family Na+:H+ antiporter [Haloactinomyces albus]
MWLASDHKLAKFVFRPLVTFLRVEAAGAIVLLAATAVALGWVNSPWADSYHALFGTEIGLSIGPFQLTGDLHHWINDALMVIFFFVVGMEIKHHIVAGELRDRRTAVVPAVAALGGMIVPAVIYAAFNAGGPGSAGWGIPMATDIAFALGVIALLGPRIPTAARVFLLTLAIVDDIGAITVIAVFYTEDLSLVWLAAAVLGTLAVAGLRLVRVWSVVPYLLLGTFVWLATYESGVHATIAGVVMGLLTPAAPLLNQEQARRRARETAPAEFDVNELRRHQFLLAESVPVAQRLQRALHPWSSYVVLPLFALSNAGIPLSGEILSSALTSPVTRGIVVGLVLGKISGIVAFSWLSVRLGFGQLPEGSTWGIVTGIAMVAGIGFTVSLFITTLAFTEEPILAADAKVGILGGSVIAACLGAAILVLATHRKHEV